MPTGFVSAVGRSTPLANTNDWATLTGGQLAFAVENDWILLTFDDDFLSLIEGEGLDHRGIIHTDQAGKRIGDVVRATDTYLDDIDAETVEIHHL